jgi:hypothetical protein
MVQGRKLGVLVPGVHVYSLSQPVGLRGGPDGDASGSSNDWVEL